MLLMPEWPSTICAARAEISSLDLFKKLEQNPPSSNLFFLDFNPPHTLVCPLGSHSQLRLRTANLPNRHDGLVRLVHPLLRP
jgi:hypothetical protein